MNRPLIDSTHVPAAAPDAKSKRGANSTISARLGNLIFWGLVVGALVYIFFWPNVTIESKLLKGFLAMLLFGMAYANSQQERVKEVEERVASLEGKLSGVQERLDEFCKSEDDANGQL
jgi:hypothetical protein